MMRKIGNRNIMSVIHFSIYFHLYIYFILFKRFVSKISLYILPMKAFLEEKEISCLHRDKWKFPFILKKISLVIFVSLDAFSIHKGLT